MRRAVRASVCAVVLGCGPGTGVGEADEAADGETTTGAETTSGTETTSADTTSETETTGPDEGCYPSICDYECGQTYDDCGQPNDGVCEGEVCVCESPGDCLPCGSAGECLDWEACFGEFSVHGECDFVCYYEFEFLWDPDAGCVIELDEQLPPDVFFAWFTKLGDQTLVEAEDCAEPDAFVLDTDAHTLTLCPGACAQFEAGAPVHAGWAIFCE
jgi:hypothetical protein